MKYLKSTDEGLEAFDVTGHVGVTLISETFPLNYSTVMI